MDLNRKEAPPIADIVIDTALHPEVVSISSGVKVHILEDNIQPIARVEFVFRAGKWYQPKAGVASLTAKMLKEGTLQKSAKQIADSIDFYGASLEISHGFDRSTLTLYCLSKHLEPLLPLALELIEQPAFPEEEFELMKQRVIQTLAVDKQKNSYLSSETFTSAIYGQDHPYSNLINEEEIAAITIQDLKNFHSSCYRLTNSEVFLTGEIPASSKNLLFAVLDGLPAQAVQNTEWNQILNSGTTPQTILQPSSNKMQASIRIGCTVVPPGHSDYAAFYVLNHTLGGYFGARLMKNIREDKGYTYGIYSSISSKEKGSLFSIGTDIKGDKINETLTEISKEISALQHELVPKEELLTVQKHIAGKFISDTSTIFDKMDKYKSTVFFNLPPDFYSQLQHSVKDLTSTELKSIAEKYLKEESLYIVVVGGEH
ncbi:M16 family metallopeptidase [Rufibacter roseus]|uniref:M16 family metallopeptidase n=1 Tax=Rufibacter roseus TaxID=1567108 RepID=A0ABW2DDP7_9BACT|nr:pitrilysin family protein [Rufibacter roseus]